MPFIENSNFYKEFEKEIREQAPKITLDFLKQFKCPICGKRANIKSVVDNKINFYDLCHEEFRELLEAKLK